MYASYVTKADSQERCSRLRARTLGTHGISREEGGGAGHGALAVLDDVDCVEVICVGEHGTDPGTDYLGHYVDGNLPPREVTEDSKE